MPGMQTRVSARNQGWSCKRFFIVVSYLATSTVLMFVTANGFHRGASTLRLVETRREREHLCFKCIILFFQDYFQVSTISRTEKALCDSFVLFGLFKTLYR
jgi:hypothetical protein